MKKCAFLLVLILAWSSPVSWATEYTWFRTSTEAWKKGGRPDFLEGKISALVLDSLDAIYRKAPQQYTFYEKGEKIYIQVNCTFDLYEVQGDQLINQYQYNNKGYNCASHPFAREGTHYLFGGHGFWTSHLDLLAFDELHGSWELVTTKNQPRDLYTSLVYQNSEGLVALFGEYTNPRYGMEEKNTQGFFLDWDTREWKPVEFQIEGLDSKELATKWGLFVIQTQDYVFWTSTNGLKNISWNLIEKETGTIFYFPNKNIDMGIAPYLEIVGNVMTYPSPSGDLKTLDLDVIRQQAKEVGFVRLRSTKAQSSSPWIYGLFFGVIFLGGLWMKKVLSKKKEEGPEVPSSQKLEPIQLLLRYSGQLLTTEALDQLLGIDGQANFDSRRMKRARLINDINEQYLAQKGKELIVREKKAEDKRYVYYKIQA